MEDIDYCDIYLPTTASSLIWNVMGSIYMGDHSFEQVTKLLFMLTYRIAQVSRYFIHFKFIIEHFQNVEVTLDFLAIIIV